MTDIWTVERIRKLSGRMVLHLNHGRGQHSYAFTFPNCPGFSYKYSSKRGRIVSRTYLVGRTELPDLQAVCDFLNARDNPTNE